MQPILLLDITRLLGRLLHKRQSTGVDRVGLAYIRHYQARAQAMLSQGRYSTILSLADSRHAFSLVLNPTADAIARARRLIWKARLTGWKRQCTDNGILLHTAHQGLEHPDFGTRLTRHKIRLVSMVHDLIPITHGEYCRPGETEKHYARLTNILTFASAVITNSQSTLNELEKIAGDLKLSIPLSKVAHLASGLSIAAPKKRPLASSYFIIVGTIEARKNHLLLLQIWQRLSAKLGDKTPHLVIIGQRGWECENVVDLLERCKPLHHRLLEISTCDDEMLNTWLHHAQALLFPSFIEGYGMPMIEALTLGVPVIASDLPVFHEIAGDIPEYADPIDAMRWIELICAYCDDQHPLRQAQLKRMQNFTAPTWDDHFSKVDMLLEQLQ